MQPLCFMFRKYCSVVRYQRWLTCTLALLVAQTLQGSNHRQIFLLKSIMQFFGKKIATHCCHGLVFECTHFFLASIPVFGTSKDLRQMVDHRLVKRLPTAAVLWLVLYLKIPAWREACRSTHIPTFWLRVRFTTITPHASDHSL